MRFRLSLTIFHRRVFAHGLDLVIQEHVSIFGITEEVEIFYNLEQVGPTHDHFFDGADSGFEIARHDGLHIIVRHSLGFDQNQGFSLILFGKRNGQVNPCDQGHTEGNDDKPAPVQHHVDVIAVVELAFRLAGSGCQTGFVGLRVEGLNFS